MPTWSEDYSRTPSCYPPLAYSLRLTSGERRREWAQRAKAEKKHTRGTCGCAKERR